MTGAFFLWMCTITMSLYTTFDHTSMLQFSVTLNLSLDLALHDHYQFTERLIHWCNDGRCVTPLLQSTPWSPWSPWIGWGWLTNRKIEEQDENCRPKAESVYEMTCRCCPWSNYSICLCKWPISRRHQKCIHYRPRKHVVSSQYVTAVMTEQALHLAFALTHMSSFPFP